MAMKQLTLPGETVKKSNKLIRSKINISNVIGSRILASLVACVRSDDTQFKDTYSIPIKGFTDDGGKSYTSIKALCRELASATAEIETKEPTGQNVFRVFPIFAELKYEKGIVEAQFNHKMSGLLLELKSCFTQYNLLEYLQLPSVYSQRIFEILKSWSNVPEVIIQLNELHQMLGTPDSFKTNFAQFRRWVLDKAHKDINKKTDFSFEWEAIKTGRAVTAIRFVFAKKRSLELQNKKMIADQQNQSDKNNENFIKALACSKSMNPCVPKKNTVCDVCQRVGLNL